MSTDENTTTTDDRDATPPTEQAAAQEAPDHEPSNGAHATRGEGSEPEAPREAPAEAASTPRAAPAAARSEDDDDWGEQPGDDIGNRLPGAGPRDDIGNRRKDTRGGPAPKHAPPPAQARPQPKHEQPKHEARPVRPAEAAPAAQAAPRVAEALPADGEAPAAAADAPAEGEAPAATGEATAEGGAAPAKKRRRRRRRKGGAGAEGAAGAAGEAGGASAEEGAEGEEAEGEGAAAEGEGAESDEAHDASKGGAPGDGKRKKRGHGQHGAPPRERPAFSVGEEVFGKVSRVTEHAIWIDIAGKATGLFDRRELGEGDSPVEGDQFLATVASNGVRGGMLMLSQAPRALDEARTRIEAAEKSGDVVEGFVTGAVKGGLEVDIGGLRAFAPASHVDLRHGADLGYLVGQRLDFTVAQYAKKGRDIVVSRKRFLEEESRKTRAEALKSIEPGSVHKGIVRTVVQWGVFVALPEAGGVEGLVHMTEASHDRSAKLTDLFKPGSEIEVKVLRVDEKGKLWLSRRAVESDPWDAVKQKYAVGSRHKGKIARLQPFGAFIELEPGVDGLCHTADLSLKPIEHPSEVVNIGDEIEVVVASCDSASHKIALHPAPPAGEAEEPRQRVQQYKAVKVAVVQATENGLVVRILGATGRVARAFIPAGHTGTPRGTDLRKEFPMGMQFEAKVLEIDPRRGEAKLSIRALKEDTEKQAYQQYRAGVAREAKFGTFADLLNKKS